MKTLICQTNPTPNDFNGNCQQIVDGLKEGWAKNADLIVFPELAIPGYLCKDMMFRKGFVEQNLDCLQSLPSYLQADYEPHIVVGYIDRNYSGVGKPFRNMAAVFKGRRMIATYQKHLLPFYDVFDEGRYFQPGDDLAVVEICGEKWGICICEDLWNDKGSDDYNYQCNPLEAYRTRGIYNIISINGSPFVREKPTKRVLMVKKIAGNVGTIIYCNQVGGQDELVFDGNSFIVEKGLVKACAGMEPYQLYDNEDKSDQWGSILRDETYDMLKLGLTDYIRKSGFKQVVVGSSGGIDSALVLALVCDAIGPENVHGIRMPSPISSEHSKSDAKQLHDNLGCNDYVVPIYHEIAIHNTLLSLNHERKIKLDNPKPIANENYQARLRGLTLMYFSNAFDALLLSTGNKTELALGYCTLYGDMNGGFCPINDLYKMQVYEMARFFNKDQRTGRKPNLIPENILNKAPSAELAPGQTDEASLLPYPVLDIIVEGYVEHFIGDFKTFVEWARDFEWVKSKDAEEQYDRMIRLINNNEFKRRQAAPGIKVTPVAFGIGRRLPIVKG